MAYDAARINSVLRIIAERGIQFGDDIVHKHNLLDREAAQPPFKINLCTSDLRLAAELVPQDIDEIATLLCDYIDHRRLRMPAIAGIPRVGHEIGKRMHKHLLLRGADTKYLTIEKRDNGQAVLLDTGGYDSGPVWLIDDLSNRGITKLWAEAPLRTAGYTVCGVLVMFDYGLGAEAALSDRGIRLAYVSTVETALIYGHDYYADKAPHFKESLAYLLNERRALRAKKLTTA